MKAVEWIDKIKVTRHWDSDYRIAKELGVGRATVSNYRNRGGTLDEEMSIKVAGLLGEKPEAVLLDQYAERTKNPDVREVLQQMARRLCILCKVPKRAKTIADSARQTWASAGFH